MKICCRTNANPMNGNLTTGNSTSANPMNGNLMTGKKMIWKNVNSMNVNLNSVL